MNAFLFAAFFLPSFAAFSAAAVKGQVVDYQDGAAVLQGYFAYDEAAKERRPGVLVFHAWKGHDAYVRRRADQLAAMGYLAFAADMYGKGIYAKDHEEAKELSGLYRGDRKLMRSRAEAALKRLNEHPMLAKGKTAAIGYCFGGTTVLEMARAGQPLTGVASFHGNLGTPMPAEPKAVKAKILVLHGAEDKGVNKDMEAFLAEMRASGADWQLLQYGGAVHGFTEKEAGEAYDAKADRRSWAALTDFLAEIFPK